MSRHYGFTNPIIFDKTYETNGKNWRKVIVSRGSGVRASDPYIFTPDNTKLRSGPDLLDYIAKNEEYWPHFNARLINFDRVKSEDNDKFSSNTRKLISFLEAVNNGATCEQALQSIQHAAKPPKPPRQKPANNFRRKNYSNQPQSRPRIGPKSVMLKRYGKSNGKTLSREHLDYLEKRFVENKMKPNPEQIEIIANVLKVNPEIIFTYFQHKWRGKLDYEYSKSQQSEDLDSENRGHRQLKKFEPEFVEDNSLYEEDGATVELENAEDDF